jgi:tripartite-type tricarboxylate transporter receptor subunit TctC
MESRRRIACPKASDHAFNTPGEQAGIAARALEITTSRPREPARRYAKANPGKINMAAGGAGSATHIFGELFKMMAGVDLTPVQYRGSGPALIGLIGGQVQAMFDALSSSIEHIRAGRLRPLAVATATRLEVLPNIPTVGEFVPGYEAVVWQGIGAPRNTPPEIVDNTALADPKMKARFTDLGSKALPGSPADFGKPIADDTEKWGKVIRVANIKAE